MFQRYNKVLGNSNRVKNYFDPQIFLFTEIFFYLKQFHKMGGDLKYKYDRNPLIYVNI